MCIVKNFPGEKPPTQGEAASNAAGARLTRGDMGEGGEGKGREKGRGRSGKGWEPPRICMLPTPMQAR
jgi:hypothetical protein